MSKKSKKGDAKGDDFGETIKPPASFLISRQLDQEKIDFLTKRIEANFSNHTHTHAHI